MKNRNFLKFIGGITLSSFILFGCDDDQPNNLNDLNDQKKNDTVKVEDKTTPPPVGKFDNSIFSIPSPIQLSGIIQKSGVPYDAEMLNNHKKTDKYTTLTQQALNLGIYGADLGYTTLYDNQQEALKYMKAAKSLSDKLGISEAFDQESIAQIERNLDNKDSLLYLVSNSYRKADDYLQTADRKVIGALIIVGGWIESLHFAGQLGKDNKNQEIMNIIGLQKHTLETMLDKMLHRYLGEPGVEEVYNQLEDLMVLFDQVEIKYSFVKPVHDADKKETTITSKSEVKISEKTFIDIADKIELLRNQIIQ